MPTEIATPKNKPLMSPSISVLNEQKGEDFPSMNSNSRYMMNTNSIPYEERHMGNSDANSQIISLSMYNSQGINPNKNLMGQFTEKNIKTENLASGIEKRDDDYDMNEEGELFPLLTKERIVEIKRFENEIKTKNDEDKVNLAINSLKIKRHPVTL